MSELLLVLVLLVVSGHFTLAETALLTARRVRLQQRADDGDARAAIAIALAEDATPFLAAVQIAGTVLTVLASMIGGAALAANVAGFLPDTGWLAPYRLPIATGIVATAIAFLSILIEELVPKRIALAHPERIAVVVARPMASLTRLAGPLVTLMSGSVALILRVLGIRGSSEPTVTHEEIVALVDQGTEAGVVGETEQALVERVFRLGDREAGALMTPRHELDWVDVNATPEQIRQELAAVARAVVLVAEEDLDHVLGIVYAEDILALLLRGDTLNLRAVLRPPVYAPSSLPAYALLEQLRKAREHVALLLDEYGGVEGMVTLDDILGELVGDVVDRSAQPAVTRREDGSWLVDGALAVHDLEDLTDLGEYLPEGVTDGDYRTVAGFVMGAMGRVPERGAVVMTGALRWEVVDMDGRRIDALLVSRGQQVPAA